MVQPNVRMKYPSLVAGMHGDNDKVEIWEKKVILEKNIIYMMLE